MNGFQTCAQALIAAGRQLYAQNMVPATSGNLSARLANDHLAITVSGRHKCKLTEQDIMQVDAQGRSLDDLRPSAETLSYLNIIKAIGFSADEILFLSDIEAELVYHKKFADRDEARSAIFDYIEVFYNRQRLHQTLNYKSPIEYEMINVA